MYIINHPFLTVLLFLQITISLQKDIKLHYPSRIHRSDDDDSGTITALAVLAQIVSLIIFVFYMLIILGFIKACLGICCSEVIGELGLDIILDFPLSEYPRNTQFCTNVVFFLVLPFALMRKLCTLNRTCHKCGSTQEYPKCGCGCNRESAGSEKNKKKTEKVPIKPKKLKEYLDVYQDGNDSEAEDTQYVLEQLYKSEQSLRDGV